MYMCTAAELLSAGEYEQKNCRTCCYGLLWISIEVVISKIATIFPMPSAIKDPHLLEAQERKADTYRDWSKTSERKGSYLVTPTNFTPAML